VTTATAASHGSLPRSLRIRVGAWADRRVAPYAFISPFYLIFATFSLFPILYTAYVSLHDWHIFGDREWVGPQNYVDLATDPRFSRAVVNTLSIFVLSTVPQLLLALALATALHHRMLKGNQLFRIGMIIPNITSVVAVAVIFESIFGFNFGIVNVTLDAVGLDPIRWQTNRFASHFAIATMVMWRWTGYNALIYLAGLQSVSAEMYEAAAVDGASGLQRFLHITIPALRPVIIFTVIVSTIGGLQLFAEPLLFDVGPGVRGGSDRQFLTLMLFVYEQAFREFNLGYASAIAWLLFLICVVVALANVWLVRRIRSAD
jgi:cellobiose transport system permease protein